MFFKKSLRKIFNTTDGLFNGLRDIDKRRPVAVVDQRRSDGALALVKLHEKSGKKNGVYIKDLTLSPKKHPSLKHETIVEKNVRYGIKTGKKHTPIYKSDLQKTNDKLTRKELRTVQKGLAGNTKDTKKKHKDKMRKWHKRKWN